MPAPRLRRAALFAALLGTLAFAHREASTRASEAMARAAGDFLASLSEEQRGRATFPLASDERHRWNFIPNEMHPRKGVWLKEMTPAQRAAATALVRTGLSQRGFGTATAIMELENVVRAMEPGGRFARHPEEYFVSVFGTPQARGTWAFRFEGHHVSLHFTVVGGEVTVSTPTFFGTNPADVREGPSRGLRILAREEDAARELLVALTDAQRAQAVLSPNAPNDILTANRFPVDPLSPAGVTAGALTAEQRRLLEALVETYTSQMAEAIAQARWSRIRAAGFDKVTFAWMGAAERGARHYYRVQGPTFLIEYDNTQNNANHVHSVWRDFAGDFGADLIRQHLRESPHHRDAATGGGAKGQPTQTNSISHGSPYTLIRKVMVGAAFD